MKVYKRILDMVLTSTLLFGLSTSIVMADALTDRLKAFCFEMPGHARLRAALCEAVTGTADCSAGPSHGGFNLNMWAVVVNRDGLVCRVVFTGDDRGDQWPGSRAIAAQKANTANAFSLPNLALSTAQLWELTRDQGSLADLVESNPVNTSTAYRGPSALYGTRRDPMLTFKIGGVNIFGGGLALYNSDGEIIGGLGVSGDSSCEDHVIAWNTRFNLRLFMTPTPDPLTFTDSDGGTGGFGHPHCLGHGNDGLNGGNGVVDNEPAPAAP